MAKYPVEYLIAGLFVGAFAFNHLVNVYLDWWKKREDEAKEAMKKKRT